MIPETIQLGGVSYMLTHILSFESEKEFVDYFDVRLYQDLSASSRKKNLKSVYKIAKKMEKAQEKNEVLTNENAD
jgi:hypothetical protein